MLLSSVILILREVLEAALLVSLLMALSRRAALGMAWVPVAMLAGLFGAAIYGFNTDHVSALLDGVGQEVTNALLQIGIYALLGVLAAVGLRQARGLRLPRSFLPWLMGCAVCLAVVREGSEIMLYLWGFLPMPEQRSAVLGGSLIGAGIGVSAGAVFYFGLLSLGRRTAAVIGGALLALVAAGMIMQSTQLLMQADWLPSGYPVWDSSWLIDESSVTGQVLYALVGYEASPTALQLGLYVGSLSVLAVISVIAASRWAQRGHAG